MAVDSQLSKHRSVAVAVVERDGCFLIGRRPDDVELGGLWEFPGGKIEADECTEDAALRECLEETGIYAEVVGSHGRVAHDYGQFTVDIHFVACRPIDGDAQPAEPFRWVAARELIHFEFPPANAELIRSLLQHS